MPAKKYKAVCKELFEENDANNNGQLDFEEYLTLLIACAKAAGVDDQSPMIAEMVSSSSNYFRNFQKMDKNKDGAIDWEECWALFKENSP